jgi:hypothetical protein
MRIKISKVEWEGLNKVAEGEKVVKYFANDKNIYMKRTEGGVTDTFIFGRCWTRCGDKLPSDVVEINKIEVTNMIVNKLGLLK